MTSNGAFAPSLRHKAKWEVGLLCRAAPGRAGSGSLFDEEGRNNTWP